MACLSRCSIVVAIVMCAAFQISKKTKRENRRESANHDWDARKGPS